MDSCFGLDLDRPACRAVEFMARAHPVEGHDNNSLHRLGRTRALHPTGVMDRKVCTPQIKEVPGHPRISLSRVTIRWCSGQGAGFWFLIALAESRIAEHAARASDGAAH